MAGSYSLRGLQWRTFFASDSSGGSKQSLACGSISLASTYTITWPSSLCACVSVSSHGILTGYLCLCPIFPHTKTLVNLDEGRPNNINFIKPVKTLSPNNVTFKGTGGWDLNLCFYGGQNSNHSYLTRLYWRYEQCNTFIWKLWGRIHFQVPSSWRQNSVPCRCTLADCQPGAVLSF